MNYNTPDIDWGKLTMGERIKHLEVEGYIVMPDVLSPEHIKKLKLCGIGGSICAFKRHQNHEKRRDF